MRGRVRLPNQDGHAIREHRVMLHLHAQAPDLQMVLDDPVHAVQPGGTIHVDGLMRQPVEVDGATLHLMVAADRGPRRRMDYTIPFTDDAGNPWLLQGSKRIERRWFNGPWRATTVLYCAIVPPESRYESMVPTGRVVISTVDVFRLLASVRTTGTSSAAEAARTVARFVAFFADAVLQAYLAPIDRPARRGRP
jgi:cholesterol oxidase